MRLASTAYPGNLSAVAAAEQAYSQRFQLPREHELAILPHRVAQEEAIAATGLTSGSLGRRMSEMEQPWLRISHQDQSIAAFAQLHFMGGILHKQQPYGADVTAAFRANLGDFRSPVDMSALAYVDPQAREDLYIDRGFNPDLTDFTLAAFYEITSKAGVDDDDEDYKPTEAAYGRLLRFEVRFRRFLVAQMMRTYGERWMKQRLPGEMRDRWSAKREDAISKGAPDGELIDFADIGDYIFILEQRNHWEDCFRPVFHRIENVRESLIRLFPIRNATAHSRLITLKDATIISYETARILEAIRRQN